MDNLSGGCKPQAMEMQLDEKLIWNLSGWKWIIYIKSASLKDQANANG
jgi:hypothetical protein